MKNTKSKAKRNFIIAGTSVICAAEEELVRVLRRISGVAPTTGFALQLWMRKQVKKITS
ncbi:MAG: hypothetical protein NC452_06260 [Eubacterium sp.]|nr:hypothetical protein [Eubacterium sp.]